MVVDYAVVLNDCAKKAMPVGKVQQELKTALELIVSLAKQG
jgi:hypothetical protein